MKKHPSLRTQIVVCLIAVSIPGLLVLDAMQARRYIKLRKEVEDLESRQVELVEENQKLVTDISKLSSSDRIEQIAQEKLGMHKAKTDEIVRVEIQGNGK